MAIPNNDLFEDFLSGTAVVTHNPKDPKVQIFDPDTADVANVPALWLEYPESELTLKSVLRVMGRELDAHHAVSDPETALAILALIVESCEEGQSRAEHANSVLERTQDAQFYQSMIFPHTIRTDYKSVFETVRFGTFDPTEIINTAQARMVSYPIGLASLAGRFCIEKRTPQITIIDIAHADFYDVLAKSWSPPTAQILIDNYFQAVSRHLFSGMHESVREELCVLEAGSLVSLDESLFSQPFLQIVVGLFTWEDEQDRAWALLSHKSILNLNTPPNDLVEECRGWLKSAFGFTRFSDTKPIDQAAKSYSRFLQKAQAYRLASKIDDAFLHFIIALDLLLGDEGRPSDSVCRRAGMLSYSQLQEDMDNQIKSVRSLYNKRSKYVHEGRSVEVEDLAEAETICLEVLWVLLTALQIEGLDKVDDWLSRVDFLVAAILADKDLSSEDFASVGIPADGGGRSPPNHLVPHAAAQGPLAGQ